MTGNLRIPAGCPAGGWAEEVHPGNGSRSVERGPGVVLGIYLAV